MSDGRREPSKPKKRPAGDGGGPRRATTGRAPERAGGKRTGSGQAAGRAGSGQQGARGGSGQAAGRAGSGQAGARGGSGQEGGRAGGPGGAAGRGRQGGAGRPEPEPGFGPFRGRPPDGAPGPRRRGDDEARTVRSAAEEAVARASGAERERPALRLVRRDGDGEHGPGGKPGKAARAAKGTAARKAATASGAPGGQRPKLVRDGGRFQEALIRGARAVDRGYEQEALRILRPWRELYPESAELRELLGIAYYRVGRWNLAQKELETFVGLTDSTEQHPVLMDCARALGRFQRVEQLWEELRAVSPGAEIVTEGRIVAAGALADQGKLDQAIRVLEKAPASPRRVLPHHLRLWYALADLHERAGDIPAARALFRKVSAEDPGFVDVAERLAALS